MWYTVLPVTNMNDILGWLIFSDVRVKKFTRTVDGCQNPFDCYQSCNSDSTCQSFTYELNTKKCYLSNIGSVYNIYLQSQCVSGFRKESSIDLVYDAKKLTSWRYNHLGQLSKSTRENISKQTIIKTYNIEVNSDTSSTQCFQSCTSDDNCKYLSIELTNNDQSITCIEYNHLATSINFEETTMNTDEGNSFFEKTEPLNQQPLSVIWKFTVIANSEFLQTNQQLTNGILTSTYQDCLNLCENTANCNKATYDMNNNNCYIYDYKANLVEVKTADAANKVSFFKNLAFNLDYRIKLSSKFNDAFAVKLSETILDKIDTCLSSCETSIAKCNSVLVKYDENKCIFYSINETKLYFTNDGLFESQLNSDIFILQPYLYRNFKYTPSFSDYFLQSMCQHDTTDNTSKRSAAVSITKQLQTLQF